MKKLVVLLMFVASCATVSPKEDATYVVKSESGFIECMVGPKNVKVYSFEGDVEVLGSWVIFTPQAEVVDKVLTRRLCEVFITDDGQEDYETEEDQGLGD